MNTYYRSGFMLLAATCSNYHCASPWNISAMTMDLARTKTTSLSLYHTLIYSLPFAEGKAVVFWNGSNSKTMATEPEAWNYTLQ